MKVVSISAGGRSYDAIIGAGLLESLGSRLTSLVRGPRCAVVTDENCARLFGEVISSSLLNAGFRPTLIRVPGGESSKSFEQLRRICDEMATAGLDRSSFLVALGGGVIGDLAGLAAAIYHRGIPYVQVPTTLLAQVDSSVGGKTAINISAGKNLVGAVHQPVLVMADVDTLRTLPPREFKQGFAEIIKHAIIADASLFERLNAVAHESRLRSVDDTSDTNALRDLIARNIEIKAAIVAGDEQDLSGQRAILNFGHTVGHAIEQASGYDRFLHGEAISLGMVAACAVSVQKAGFAESEREKVSAMLKAFELPTCLPNDFPYAQILPALQADKKFERGAVRFVVANRIGAACLTSEVTLDDIARAVDTLR